MAYIVALNVTRKGVIRRWVGCVVIFTGTKRERETGVQRSWLGCVVIFEWDKDRSTKKLVSHSYLLELVVST